MAGSSVAVTMSTGSKTRFASSVAVVNISLRPTGNSAKAFAH
jgi:hypothetical protein